MASCEATAPIVVDHNDNAFAERYQGERADENRSDRARSVIGLHVALFLPFGDNNGRHIAANGGSRRFGILS